MSMMTSPAHRPSKNGLSYGHGYEQAETLASQNKWTDDEVLRQMAEWTKTRSQLRHDVAYFEHFSGVLDALADTLISRYPEPPADIFKL
jgi:hypothetical protein